LAARAFWGAPGSDVALRVFEAQRLQQVAAALTSRRAAPAASDLDELFAAVERGEPGDGPAARLTKGSDSLYRISRNIEKPPAVWNAQFDVSVKKR
jgi:hypothetical protein